MKVLVVTGRIDERAWTPGGLIKRLVHALAERGHAIEILCQAVEDPLAMTCADSVEAYETFRSGASEYGAGFPRWARARMHAGARAVSLSLSRRVGGNVWMPLDAAGGSFVSDAFAAGGLPALAGAAARHTGALLDAVARRIHPLPRGDEIRRTVCIDDLAAEAARHYAGGILSEGVIQAPLVSAIEDAGPETLDAERTAVRELLGIDPDRFTLLASFMSGGGPWLRALMDAVTRLDAGARRGHGQPGPALLVLARDPFKAHAAALAAGCDRDVRILGTTTAVRAAIAACDVAAIGAPCARNQFESGACARFGADALRCARPVLAVAGSGGQAAAELSTPEAGRAGLVVGAPTAEAWAGALATALEGDWLARARLAAERLAGQLEFSRLVDAVEFALSGAVE